MIAELASADAGVASEGGRESVDVSATIEEVQQLRLENARLVDAAATHEAALQTAAEVDLLREEHVSLRRTADLLRAQLAREKEVS